MLLVQRDKLHGCRHGLRQAEDGRKRRGLRLQLCQQFRRNGEQITASQCGDLPDVAKARPHHLGGNTMLLVVVVNMADALHTWIVNACTRRLVPGSTRRLFVPVVNTPHKWGNEFHTGLRTGHSLRKRKQQSEVGVYAFAL